MIILDKEQQIHEMTMDYMRVRFSKYNSPMEYAENYLAAYEKIEEVLAQSETSKVE